MNRVRSVAVVGLGAMGLPMARRLEAAGFAVTGIDPSAARRSVAADLRSVERLALGLPADVVLVMVATPQQLASVVDDAEGAGALSGTWILSGTVGPEAAKAEAARLRDLGADVVDAPVTGGVVGAEAGTLTLFVGGAEKDVASVVDVLQVLGEPERVGPEVGDGQVMKMVNQHLCSVHLAAAAESLAFARRCGLDTTRVLDLLGRGAAASWMLADRGPQMLAASSSVHSTVDIFVKDSALVRNAAASVGAEVPVLDAACGIFDAAQALGLGPADDSRVIDVYEEPGP